MSDDRKMTENEWAMQQHIDALTAERDRYRKALDAISALPWCETCAPGYIALATTPSPVASAALSPTSKGTA